MNRPEGRKSSQIMDNFSNPVSMKFLWVKSTIHIIYTIYIVYRIYMNSGAKVVVMVLSYLMLSWL